MVRLVVVDMIVDSDMARGDKALTLVCLKSDKVVPLVLAVHMGCLHSDRDMVIPCCSLDMASQTWFYIEYFIFLQFKFSTFNDTIFPPTM
jgi:hypothetical protein